jgi:hypothetical protein
LIVTAEVKLATFIVSAATPPKMLLNPIDCAVVPSVTLFAAVDARTRFSSLAVGVPFMDDIPPKRESLSVIWDVAAANERVSEPLSPTSVDLAARNEATDENE